METYTEKYKDVLSKYLFVNPIILHEAKQSGYNIENIPPEGILISKPGKYKFTNDILWFPKAERAITITCDDVILDMNSSTLECSSTTVKTVAIGGDNIKNIKIVNGTIKFCL